MDEDSDRCSLMGDLKQIHSGQTEQIQLIHWKINLRFN